MKVISNTAISLDGRINTVEEQFTLLGSAVDHQKMEQIRRMADAVLVGGQTFRKWPYPSLSDQARDDQRIWNVIVSRSADIPMLPQFVEETRAGGSAGGLDARLSAATGCPDAAGRGGGRAAGSVSGR